MDEVPQAVTGIVKVGKAVFALAAVV